MDKVFINNTLLFYYLRHSFRRTSTTNLANTGANLNRIKQLGNWKDPKTAERYVDRYGIKYKSETADMITASLTGLSTRVIIFGTILQIFDALHKYSCLCRSVNRTPMSMKNQNSFLHSEANLTSKLSLTNTAEVERTDSNIPISKKMKTTGMECADQVVFNAPHPVLIIPSDNQEEKFDDIMIEEFLQPIRPYHLQPQILVLQMGRHQLSNLMTA